EAGPDVGALNDSARRLLSDPRLRPSSGDEGGPLMSQIAVDRPVRVGVFSTVQQAERAVEALFAAGFRREQLSVICSAEHKEKLFGNLAHPAHPPRQTRGAIAVGGAIGATLGGLALAATALVTGDASLLAAGTVLVGGGAFAGSFTGAMMTRGFEKEIADYYD